jgi:hypothetical protein
MKPTVCAVSATRGVCTCELTLKRVRQEVYEFADRVLFNLEPDRFKRFRGYVRLVVAALIQMFPRR